MGWNRKEGRGNKDFKQGGSKLGQAASALERGRWNPLMNYGIKWIVEDLSAFFKQDCFFITSFKLQTFINSSIASSAGSTLKSHSKIKFSYFDDYVSRFFPTALKCFIISDFVGYRSNLAAISFFLSLFQQTLLLNSLQNLSLLKVWK